MRTLSACSTTRELLPAVEGLVEHISAWHDGLPPIARASELSRTPWGESKVVLAYIHLGHLGAITLIFRRTLSMYKQRPGRQKHTLHPAERGRLAAVFNDGLVAAKQASHILYLLLGEQASIRHCWTLMYDLAYPQTEKKTRLTSPPQIHSLHLRLHPALHHQPAPNPQPARSRMAALPHPNRQRLRSPSLLPRTRPRRHPAARHSLAIHAIPTSAFPRAETQSAESMGSRGFGTPFFENTTASGGSSSAAAQPRHRRFAAQRANRTRRTGPDEQRSAETGVPAVQRRCGQRRAAQQQQQQRLQQQGPAFAGRHQTRFNHTSTREVGPAGFRQ
jgi:hypothetical protein